MSAAANMGESRSGASAGEGVNGIVLPFPDKVLWPNGRPGHWAVKAREVKKHRRWAAIATQAASLTIGDSPFPVHITCHPKARGPAPDRDAIVSASKAYLDGIADALGINDRHFAAPTVTISNERTGQFLITVGG